MKCTQLYNLISVKAASDTDKFNQNQTVKTLEYWFLRIRSGSVFRMTVLLCDLVDPMRVVSDAYGTVAGGLDVDKKRESWQGSKARQALSLWQKEQPANVGEQICFFSLGKCICVN